MYNENNSNDFYDYHTTSSKKDKLDKDNLIEILDEFNRNAVNNSNSTDYGNKKEKPELDNSTIKNYLENFGMTSLTAGKPYCLNGPSEPAKFKWFSKKQYISTIVIMFIMSNLLQFVIAGFNSSLTLFTNLYMVFAAIGVAIVFHNVFEHNARLKSGFYNEKVDAVCIEVEASKKTSRSKSGNTYISYVYRPIIYAKCMNGYSYILFKNMYISYKPYPGEIYKLNVNNNNPLYFEPSVINKSMRSHIIDGIACIVFSFALYFLTMFIYKMN